MLYTFLTWIAASFALVAFPVSATPPQGCLENSKGQRWCEGLPVRYNSNPVRDTPKSDLWVHPATVKSFPKLYEPVGQQVAALPVDEFLPGYRPRVTFNGEPWVGVLPKSKQTELTPYKPAQ